MITAKPNNIDEYISGFPKETQEALEQVRTTIKKAAPEAEETISYAIPTFTLHKQYLVYFAAFKNHIGFYALPSGNQAFQEEISHYKTGKGSIQFALDKPMPLDLIAKITEFRIKEVSDRLKTKKKVV